MPSSFFLPGRVLLFLKRLVPLIERRRRIFKKAGLPMLRPRFNPSCALILATSRH